ALATSRLITRPLSPRPLFFLPTPIRYLSTAVAETTPKPLKQAENRDRTWSVSQQPKSKAFVGPRFEQTDIDFQVIFSESVLNHTLYNTFNTQPNRPAAIELIAQEPIRYVSKRIVACDGGK
ncbi:hypothetical protein BC938DRAFT_478594, partial [Jimgerdemannia flammicorona]